MDRRKFTHYKFAKQFQALVKKKLPPGHYKVDIKYSKIKYRKSSTLCMIINRSLKCVLFSYL